MDKKIYNVIDDGFDTIIKIRSAIKKRIEDIEKIKCSVKQNYIDCIEKESKNYFGLDSVQFQNKLIELEFENMLNLYSYIDNRIYGDYYKLFFLMNDYLQEKLLPEQYSTIKELKKIDIYPVYKDLDFFKAYDFDIINNIHKDVIHIIKTVYEKHIENEDKITTKQESLYYGVNLDNYIINQQYLNKELYMTNDLHRNYICVYHKLHNNVLHNFLEKINLFFNQINHHTVETDTEENEELTSTLNMDKFSEIVSDVMFDNECNSLFKVEEIKQTSKLKPNQKPNLTPKLEVIDEEIRQS